MSITLEQARVLNAISDTGSVSAAAKTLGKAHTSILYAIKELEAETELRLLDRSGYRRTLTPAGEKVLEECQRLLQVEDRLKRTCVSLRSGWEPNVKIVLDGALAVAPILRAMGELQKLQAPTRVQIRIAHHRQVSEVFENEKCDLMVSVVPPSISPRATGMDYGLISLKPVPMSLVVHRDHPLGLKKKHPLEDLRRSSFLTIQGSDDRLRLSTASLAQHSPFQFGDFLTKRSALLNQLGFGWMPEWLISMELRLGILKAIHWEGENRHVLKPQIYWLKDRKHERATSLIIRHLQQDRGAQDCKSCKIFPKCDRCPNLMNPSSHFLKAEPRHA